MNNDGRLFVSQRHVKKEQSSIRNHLLSVVRDADMVLLVQSVFPHIPLVANERNGVWYCPVVGTSSCYFKSTDGHPSQWNFSLSRMNLDFARTAMRKGALLLDSTRRSKRFPDSLSVTVPIWIAVINAIVFGQKAFSLEAPPWVPSSHVEQISQLIPSWIESVSETVKTMIRQLLCDHLLLPFQPVWVCGTEDQSLEWFGSGAESLLEGDESTSLSFTPLILLSASAVTSDDIHSQHHSWQYIQGAGDDEEAWAEGLSPALFWKHKEFILASDDYREVEAAVEHVVTHHRQAQGLEHGHKKSKNVDVTTVANDDDTHLPVQLHHIGESGIYIIHSCSNVNDAVNEVQRHTKQMALSGVKMALSGVIEIIPHCGNAITRACAHDSAIPLLEIHATLKQPRSHFSAVSIPAVIAFYGQLLVNNKSDDAVLLAIVDHDDGTLAYTVAMTILLEFFKNSASLNFLQSERETVNKSKGEIQGVLTALQIHIPQVRIPRALMKELNAYFVAHTRDTSER